MLCRQQSTDTKQANTLGPWDSRQISPIAVPTCPSVSNSWMFCVGGLPELWKSLLILRWLPAQLATPGIPYHRACFSICSDVTLGVLFHRPTAL